MVKVVDKRGVVAAEVAHHPAHSGKAFAKAKIIRGIGFGRLSGGPIPIVFLHVNDINRMVLDGGAILLKA